MYLEKKTMALMNEKSMEIIDVQDLFKLCVVLNCNSGALHSDLLTPSAVLTGHLCFCMSVCTQILEKYRTYSVKTNTVFKTILTSVSSVTVLRIDRGLGQHSPPRYISSLKVTYNKYKTQQHGTSRNHNNHTTFSRQTRG